jgi:hypothetical protein
MVKLDLNGDPRFNDHIKSSDSCIAMAMSPYHSVEQDDRPTIHHLIQNQVPHTDNRHRPACAPALRQTICSLICRRTVLHAACEAGREEVCRRLLAEPGETKTNALYAKASEQ